MVPKVGKNNLPLVVLTNVNNSQHQLKHDVNQIGRYTFAPRKKTVMKKYISLLIVLITASGINAQSHEQGNLFLSGGIGLGHYGYHHRPGKAVGVGLPLIVNLDYGIIDYVSIGGYAGSLFKDNHVAFGFGGRGNFHAWQMVNDLVAGDLKGDIFDVYVSVYTGTEISNVYTNRFRIGGILGGRWFFKENIALMAEFGGPMSFANFGISLKLKD